MTGLVNRALNYLADKSYTKTAQPSITTSTGSVTQTHYRRYGNVANLLVVSKNAAAKSAGSIVMEGTIPKAYRPSLTAYGIATYSNMMASVTITPEGVVRTRMANGTLPANTELYGNVTYVLT